jgi:Transposase IS116/IS110/IS902 family
VRLDRDHHRPVAGDSDLADSVKLLARAHQSAVWERTRHVLRLRSALLEFFPAAVEAFEDLAAADTLRLLRRAPDPVRAAKLTRSQLVAALRASRRHHAEARAAALLAVLRAPVLRQSPTLEGAYATIVVGQVGIISALNGQISQLQKVMTEHFGRHPAADIYLSQPGFGVVLASRVLGEFGDDKNRFSDARARKNYSGQSPITRASGKKTIVLARYATNRRLGVALHLQAFAALGASLGARAYYDALRERKIGHHAALRQLANRLVGILHGCLKTATLYNEDTAWAHHRTSAEPGSA